MYTRNKQEHEIANPPQYLNNIKKLQNKHPDVNYDAYSI